MRKIRPDITKSLIFRQDGVCAPHTLEERLELLDALAASGRVLLVRHDLDDERWWLPGEDLRPYQHPDERAREVLEEIGGLTCRSIQMVFVESFRGRRGWHVVFHYRADVDGEPSGNFVEAGWFDGDLLSRTMHGAWERRAVNRVLAQTAA